MKWCCKILENRNGVMQNDCDECSNQDSENAKTSLLSCLHISSVHNGFQLWALDFFILKLLFSFLCMYRSRFFCSFLFCLGKAVMPSDIVRQLLFLFQQCDDVFCHRRRFRYIPQSGNKSLYAVSDSCLSLLSHRLQFVL